MRLAGNDLEIRGSSGSLEFYTGSADGDSSTQRLTIDSSGRVGINRTPSITGSKLEVGGADNTSLINVEASGVTGGMGIGSTGLQLFHGSSAKVKIDSAGRVTQPYQPAFQVNPASVQSNIAVGSGVTVVFGTEVFDVGANFASNTFTAPVTGKYQLNLVLYFNSLDTASDYYVMNIGTSNRSYTTAIDPGAFSSDPVYWFVTLCVLADMDASDTASVTVNQASGTVQTDIATGSKFSGYLVA
jgi:hypothetical protein